MHPIKKALVLAAGFGSRLRPLTDEVPKCLTEVHGKPILEHTLIALQKHGVQEVTVVVGYMGQTVIDKFGEYYGPMKMNYLWNEVYDQTNSMYSAWIGRSVLEQGCLLIEGDTFFDSSLIGEALSTNPEYAYWVVDQFKTIDDGSMSIADEDGRIQDLKIVRGKLKEYKSNFYKSTGIVKVTKEYGQCFSKWLDDEVKKDNTNVYYDLVIADHLQDQPILVCDISGKRWIEIDSLEDLRRTEKIFRPTKHVVLLLDGASDETYSEIENKTPIEYSQIPNIDRLAKEGRTGLMQTSFPGLPVGSIVANMGILGYNPMRYYPSGRASFEALAQDIYLQEGELAFRCNFVSVDDKGMLTDFTAGNISDEDGKALIEELKFDDAEFRIYPGQSYRNVLIVKGVDCVPSELKLYEPHMNVGEMIEDMQIEGLTDGAKELAVKLNYIMRESRKQFQDLNKKYGTKADMLFPWSASSDPHLPSFSRKYSIDGAVVTGIDFLRGIAIASRMENRRIPGATGYSDTDLGAKLKYAKNCLRYNDFVFIHINGTDEEGHNKSISGKVAMLERVDKELLEPLLSHLEEYHKDNYKIAVMPDHYTVCRDGKHNDKLIPYLVWGKNVKRDDVESYSENSISHKSKTILKSYEFMDFFLERAH